MQTNMFKDVVRLLKRGAHNPGVAWLALRHTNKAQAQELAKKFPQYYRVAKTGRVMLQTNPGTAGSPGKTTKSVDGGLNKTVVLGGYGHKAAAERECQQFMHPNVFQYQSAIFPDPRDHGVNVLIVSADPVEVTNPTTPLNPWGVKMNLEVTGDNAAVWLKKFEDRIRIQRAM
jgi:hypothetical protein